jgi:hypothetical protein
VVATNESERVKLFLKIGNKFYFSTPRAVSRKNSESKEIPLHLWLIDSLSFVDFCYYCYGKCERTLLSASSSS